MALEISKRQPRQSLLFFRIDGLGGMAGVVATAGFDLDEDDRASVDRDQIELSQTAAFAPGHDLVAQPLHVPLGGPFATAIERVIAQPNAAQPFNDRRQIHDPGPL